MTQQRNRQAAIGEIGKALGVLLEPGDVVEPRVPNAGQFRTVSGYFDDMDKLAAEAARPRSSRSSLGVRGDVMPIPERLPSEEERRRRLTTVYELIVKAARRTDSIRADESDDVTHTIEHAQAGRKMVSDTTLASDLDRCPSRGHPCVLWYAERGSDEH